MSFATEEHKSTKQKILEAGASLLQSKDPVKSFKQHLAAVYFVAGDLNRQVLLHSYLNSFNEEFGHSLLYDGERSDSKLVGIQYIISERVFLTLPEVEKKLWHSFHYMVKSGLIIAPSLPSVAEQPLMTHLAACYGKTFLFWDTTVSPLPYGIPQMMMSFTADGQANEMYVKQMYADADVNPSSLLKKREKTSTPVIHTGADNWRTGEVYQLRLENISSQSNNIPSNNFSSTLPPTSSLPLTPVTPLTTPTTNATTPLSVPQYTEASISHPVGIPTAYGQSNSTTQSPYYPSQQGTQQYQQQGTQQYPQQGTQQYGNQQYQQYGNQQYGTQQGSSYPSYGSDQQSMTYGTQSTTPSSGDQQRRDYSSFSSPNNTNNSTNDSSSSSPSNTSPTSFNSSSSPSTSSTKSNDVLIEKKITTTSYSPTKDNTPSSLLTTTTTITKKADAKTD